MTIDTLPALLGEALAARGYETLTPVQSAVIAPDAAGRDLIVSAQTGSGKTVAFGLAMAPELLMDGGIVPPVQRPLALVVAPTRELALQVSREFIWLYGKAGARIATCVGGMDASKERRALSHGAQIVVGTPGRLRDHLERGALDLTELRVAVLDEADEMLDMGFRDDLEAILDASPETRRTLMFSATIPKPILALAKRYQRDAMRISTVGEDRGHGDISYQAVTVAPNDIEHAVVNLLRYHDAETAMLFCATRDNVRHLHASLTERGFSAVALSGEHSQNERNYALQALRDRRARVCVATDVAARGIDLPTLSLVIHVELPRDAEALQHRSGRTGRAGKKGTAVLLVTYPRRRRVEGMLRGARINAEWISAPTPEDIARADHARLLETLLQPVEIEDEDRALAAKLMAEKTPEDIAAMLVRSHRARMPQAEELIDISARAPRQEGGRDQGPRPGFENTQWFRMNIGRAHNADPRWIMPLLCRRGHITRTEIGAIRIQQSETFFEVQASVAKRFMDAVKRSATDDDGEGGIAIVPTDGGPPHQSGGGRRDAAPRHNGPPRERAQLTRREGAPRERASGDTRHEAKPYGKKPGFGGKPSFGGGADRPRRDGAAGAGHSRGGPSYGGAPRGKTAGPGAPRGGPRGGPRPGGPGGPKRPR